ncbi:MAG: hypothetical protein DI598_17565, partial [Pseudopedobacter saltans]
MLTNGQSNMGVSTRFNYYSLSPSNAVKMQTNRRLFPFSGSSLLRVPSAKQANEDIKTKEKENSKDVKERPKKSVVDLSGDAQTDMQGNASVDRCRKL